jgi:predicted RNase H-like HicB family nuclease
MLTVELIPDTEHGGYTARLPDIPVYDEGETADEAIVELKQGLQAYFDTFCSDENQ